MQAAVATVATVAVPAKGSAVRVWATAYDVRSASGKSAIVDAARRRARTALWMCWQQGYVPRDLATVASRLTEITLRGPVLALGKDGAAHDASPREVAVMRAYMQRGHLSGLAEAFAEFLTHSGYQMPRVYSNRYCGWR